VTVVGGAVRQPHELTSVASQTRRHPLVLFVLADVQRRPHIAALFTGARFRGLYDQAMRIVFLGGTGSIGYATAGIASTRGDEFFVAHSGAHEGPHDLVATHLHGSHDELLAPDGPIARVQPDVLVDSFFGGPTKGATAAKAEALTQFATRHDVERLVAISSTDVYRYCIEAGLNGGYGLRLLPSDPLPLTEDSPVRPPDPNQDQHDNVRMEQALRESGFEGAITILRLGMVYGRFSHTREAGLVAKVKAGERRLELPARGAQFFARVSVDRVGRAVHAAARRDEPGIFTCNVVDPYGWTYAGLAAEIGRILAWDWDPVDVPFDPTTDPAHPFALASPCIFDDRRLRDILNVSEPDPRAALEDLVHWLFATGS
jgi:nucleoside-diphosphate-sugar epimerase